ncbi:hypothetical protein CTA1_3031 [Colletotrichum tanaceti]|uniref:Uncharacterized protein n=1 Tax=Colletotrichum tanaceti TaxID=1306861 RepID=A0A4U6XQ74_9PEZI|nr:hypothetical protein CTA1_3031 [Colletotrichum tanaceti]
MLPRGERKGARQGERGKMEFPANLFQDFPHLQHGEQVGLGEPMPVGAPEDLGPGTQLEDLPQGGLLPVSAQDGEDLPNVGVDVGVDARQVPGLPHKGVAGVEQDDGNGGVLADEVLQVGRRRRGEGDVVVAQAGVELDRLLAGARGVPDEAREPVDQVLVQPAVVDARERPVGGGGAGGAGAGAPGVVRVDGLKGLPGGGGVRPSGDGQAGPVADDGLEAHDLGVGDGLGDAVVEGLDGLFERDAGVLDGGGGGGGIISRGGRLGLVLPLGQVAVDDVGGHLLDADDPLGRAPRHVAEVRVRVDGVLGVEAVVDEDGLDPVQALGDPGVVVLDAPRLDGVDDGLPAGFAPEHLGQLLHGAQVRQAGQGSVDRVPVGLGGDGQERVAPDGVGVQQRMGMVVDDGRRLDGVAEESLAGELCGVHLGGRRRRRRKTTSEVICSQGVCVCVCVCVCKRDFTDMIASHPQVDGRRPMAVCSSLARSLTHSLWAMAGGEDVGVA